MAASNLPATIQLLAALVKAQASNHPIHFWWSVNVSLRLALTGVTRWRLLQWYAALSSAGSIALMFTPEKWYGVAWTAKSALLCAGNLLLVRSASRRLPEWGYPACGLGVTVVHLSLRNPLKWPDSWLESAFSGFAVSSLMLGIVMSMSWRDSNGQILAGYLLLDALTLYCATMPDVGVAVSVGNSICYLAWMGVRFLEGREAIL